MPTVWHLPFSFSIPLFVLSFPVLCLSFTLFLDFMLCCTLCTCFNLLADWLMPFNSKEVSNTWRKLSNVLAFPFISMAVARLAGAGHLLFSDVMSFQTSMTFFLLWDTEEGILKNVCKQIVLDPFDLYYMDKKDNGNPKCLISKIRSFLFCRRKRVILVWSDMRVSKWRQNLHFWVNCSFNEIKIQENCLNSRALYCTEQCKAKEKKYEF